MHLTLGSTIRHSTWFSRECEPVAAADAILFGLGSVILCFTGKLCKFLEASEVGCWKSGHDGSGSSSYAQIQVLILGGQQLHRF